MKKHDFYRRFANVPLPNRHLVTPISVFRPNKEYSPATLYYRIKEIDQKIAELNKERDELLEIADKYIP